MPRSSTKATAETKAKDIATDIANTEMSVEKPVVNSKVDKQTKTPAMKVARFSKVSYEQFVKDMTADGLTFTDAFLKDAYERIKLPTRATSGSAGYDICTPIAFDLRNLNADPKGFTFPTGIRCEMAPGYFMMIVPKSGLGFKHYSRLGNCTGIIDGDFYYSDNEGDIHVNIRSDIPNNPPVHIEAGKAVCQAIFIPYAVTDDDNATGTRNGGFGSTGK